MADLDRQRLHYRRITLWLPKEWAQPLQELADRRADGKINALFKQVLTEIDPVAFAVPSDPLEGGRRGRPPAAAPAATPPAPRRRARRTITLKDVPPELYERIAALVEAGVGPSVAETGATLAADG